MAEGGGGRASAVESPTEDRLPWVKDLECPGWPLSVPEGSAPLLEGREEGGMGDVREGSKEEVAALSSLPPIGMEFEVVRCCQSLPTADVLVTGREGTSSSPCSSTLAACSGEEEALVLLA
jgi:hypothetical protein